MDSRPTLLALQQAIEATGRRQFDKAESLLATIPAASPLYPQSRHLLGLVRYGQGRSRDALPLLLAALRGGDASPPLVPNLLLAMSAAGDCDEAVLTEAFAALVRLPPATVVSQIRAVLLASRYQSDSPPERNAIVHRALVLPLLRWLLAQDQLDYALQLESWIYSAYVKQQETEEHFRTSFAGWTAEMVSAGKRHPVGAAQLRSGPGPIRIGFFLHNASMLAHVQVLLGTLRGLRKAGERALDPVVYCFEGQYAEMLEAFRALDVPVVLLAVEYPDSAGQPFQRLRQLADRLAADRIEVVVWVSLALMMPLAFSMRIAPVQVWWAMKYHSLECAAIDRYMTRVGVGSQRILRGRIWDNVPIRFDDWVDDSQRPQAAALRAAFAGRLVLGSFGREEKLIDPAFLAAVVRILRENPATVFLYTGRQDHPAIRGAFAVAGLADRVFHIGWVDTRLYAHVIDLFLDSFPFPCGLTACQAAAVGKPIVLRDGAVARETGLPGYIMPLLEGTEGTGEEQADLRRIYGGDRSPLLFCAPDDNAYVAMAGRLLADAELRRAAGSAASAFISRFMTGTENMGRVFCAHIESAVAGRR